MLAALAGGEPMTAGQVAEKAGLARATVSTTLSKLAKSGAVEKAQRGYRLATTAPPADEPADRSAESPADRPAESPAEAAEGTEPTTSGSSEAASPTPVAGSN